MSCFKKVFIEQSNQLIIKLTNFCSAIDQFPSLERESAGAGNTNSTERDRDRERERERKGAAQDKHVREVIFALPSLQLHLRTQQLQRTNPPTENGTVFF